MSLDFTADRAVGVVKDLIAEGLDAKRLAAEGFGDAQPADPGTTAEALAKNRRIELRIDDR